MTRLVLSIDSMLIKAIIIMNPSVSELQKNPDIKAGNFSRTRVSFCFDKKPICICTDEQHSVNTETFKTAVMGNSVVDIKIVIPVFSLLGLVCILSNALVCYIVITRKVPKGVIKYYIFSLAITDILVGAVCIPVYLRIEWISFHRISLSAQAKILGYVLIVSEVLLSTSSILHLCVMAFDRVMSISKPLYHRRKLRRKGSALKLLTIPWLLAPVNAVLFVYLVAKPMNWAILVAVTIILPSCFITTCYSVLLYKIRQRNRSFSKVHNMQQINERRIIKTLLAVIITFLICWMPVFIYSTYYAANITHLPNNIRMFLKLTTFMQYLNSACNPFIYAIFNPAFRTATNNAVKSIWSSTKLSSSARNIGTTNINNNFPPMDTKL